MKTPLARALAFALVVASRAAAADAIDQCTTAAHDGQVARDDGELQESRRKFASCASADCPDLVRRDCAEWLADVDARLPSIVVTVRDGKGADVVDAHVTLDGAPVVLNGQAITVDPGRHVVVATADGRRAESTVLTAEREKSRPIVLAFEPPPSPPPPPASAPSKTQLYASYGLFGAGAAIAVASLVTFGFGYASWNELRDCRPNCASSDVEATRRLFIATDVTAGVAVVTLGVALVLFLTAPKSVVATALAGGPALRF